MVADDGPMLEVVLLAVDPHAKIALILGEISAVVLATENNIVMIKGITITTLND